MAQKSLEDTLGPNGGTMGGNPLMLTGLTNDNNLNNNFSKSQNNYNVNNQI